MAKLPLPLEPLPSPLLAGRPRALLSPLGRPLCFASSGTYLLSKQYQISASPGDKPGGSPQGPFWQQVWTQLQHRGEQHQVPLSGPGLEEVPQGLEAHQCHLGDIPSLPPQRAH